MEQNVKVSILVPFYKVEKYVGRCVESLFTQTYKNIEYIFVDDCSPDGSNAIVKQKIAEHGIEKQCKLIEHKVNRGISPSRNDCLDAMTGDYFLFVDSDDYIDSDMVERLVEAAVANNADVAGCGYVEEYPDHSVEHPQHYSNDHDQMLRDITILRLKGVMWKLLISGAIVREHRLEVRFIEKEGIVDDYYFCCAVFYYAKGFAGVDRCMYHWSQYNPNSYTQTTARNVEEQATAIAVTERFYKEKGVLPIVADALLHRKFIAKLPLLLNNNCINVRRWRELFPESSNAWRDMSDNFTFGNRLRFRLAQMPVLWHLVQIF